MEVDNSHIQSNPVAPQPQTKIHLIVIISLVTLILGAFGGYLLGSKSASQTASGTQIQQTTQNNSVSSVSQGNDKLSNVIYFIKYTDAGPANEKTLFVTKDNTGESFKVADSALSDASTKTVYKFGFPSAIGFHPPFSIVNNYIVAPVVGADANDILIFTLNGEVISKGLRQSNTELSNWLVSYDSVVKDNIIKIKLFQVDNSTGSAQVDLSTGKLVPGSLTKLGKLQQ